MECYGWRPLNIENNLNYEGRKVGDMACVIFRGQCPRILAEKCHCQLRL